MSVQVKRTTDFLIRRLLLTAAIRTRVLVLGLHPRKNCELLTTIKIVNYHMNHNTRSVLTVFEVFQYGMSTGNGEALSHWRVSWTYLQYKT